MRLKRTTTTSLISTIIIVLTLIKDGLDLLGEIDYWQMSLYIILACLIIIAYLFDRKAKKEEDEKLELEKEKNNLPDLTFSISKEKNPYGIMPRYEGHDEIIIENINPTVGALDVSIIFSHNGGEFEKIKPSELDSKYGIFDEVFEIPPMDKVAIPCIMRFYDSGSYRLCVRFRPSITTLNAGWSGLKYVWSKEFEFKCDIEEYKIGKKNRCKPHRKVVSESKTKREGKINGNP